MRDEGAEQWIQEHFPVPTPGVTGDAARFLQFLQEELIPLIESDYRAEPGDRTLLGHSGGGEFAFYALFQQPQLFQRYVVASAIPVEDDEQEYAEHHDSLPVRMHYIMEGGLAEEDLARFNSSVALLESRQYAGFRLTHHFFANCTHCSVVAPAFQAGLVEVFS